MPADEAPTDEVGDPPDDARTEGEYHGRHPPRLPRFPLEWHPKQGADVPREGYGGSNPTSEGQLTSVADLRRAPRWDGPQAANALRRRRDRHLIVVFAGQQVDRLRNDGRRRQRRPVRDA